MHQYSIHEIFGPTIQGEASMAGVPCIFIRFSRCNMWTGRAEDKADSHCPFCDTEFDNRIPMTLIEVVNRVNELANPGGVQWVWISGGEPVIQVDRDLLAVLREYGYKIGMETNGTLDLKPGVEIYVNHLVVSPKRSWDRTKIRKANDLKILYPHPDPDIHPHLFAEFDAYSRWIQPLEDQEDESKTKANMEQAVEFVTKNAYAGWRLSVQTHKILGVP